MKKRARSGLVKHALVFIGFLFLAIAFTYPAILDLTGTVVGDSGDNIAHLSYLYLAKQNISLGKLPFAFTNTYRFPYGFSFRMGSDGKLFVLLGSLLSFFMSESFAFNILILLTLAANAFVSYFVFYKLSKHRAVSILGGIIYGNSYVILAWGAGYVDLMQIYGIPILFYAIYRAWKKRSISIGDLSFILSAFLLISLGSLQTALYCFVAFLLFMPYFLKKIVFDKEPFSVELPSKRSLGLYGLGFVVALFLLFWFEHIRAFPSLADYRRSPRNMHTLLEFVVPNGFYPTLIYQVHERFEVLGNIPYKIDIVYLGAIEVILLFGFLIFATYSLNKLLFIIPVAILVFWSAYGGLYPFQILKAIFPFSTIRQENRLFPIYYFFISWAIVSFLRKLSSRKFFPLLLTLVYLFVFVERFSGSFKTTEMADFLGSSYTRAVALSSGNAVLNIPVIRNDKPYALTFGISRYNLLPFFYQKPITQGYFHWLGDTTQSRRLIEHPFVDRLRCLNPDTRRTSRDDIVTLLSTLMEQHIDTLVIHKKIYSPDSPCGDLQELLELGFGVSRVSEADPSDITLDCCNSKNLGGFSVKKVFEDNEALVLEIDEPA